MRTVLFNGSPHPKGTTAFALSLVASELESAGIETTTFQVGAGQIRGCIGCHRCRETHRCVFDDDRVNEFIGVLEQSDAVVLGAPTYYFGTAGQARAFLDRAFYAISNDDLRLKPAAVVSVARRAGAVLAAEGLMHYPVISQMPVVSSCYPPIMFGHNAEEAAQDAEGVRTMMTLGRNLAWLLKGIEAGRKAGVTPPEKLPPAMTNFIR